MVLLPSFSLRTQSLLIGLLPGCALFGLVLAVWLWIVPVYEESRLSSKILIEQSAVSELVDVLAGFGDSTAQNVSRSSRQISAISNELLSRTRQLREDLNKSSYDKTHSMDFLDHDVPELTRNSIAAADLPVDSALAERESYNSRLVLSIKQGLKGVRENAESTLKSSHWLDEGSEQYLWYLVIALASGQLSVVALAVGFSRANSSRVKKLVSDTLLLSQEQIAEDVDFPQDELGEIGRAIMNASKKLSEARSRESLSVERLMNSQQDMTLLLESVQVALLEVNQEGIIVFANRAFAAISKASLIEVIGKHLFDFLRTTSNAQISRVTDVSDFFGEYHLNSGVDGFIPVKVGSSAINTSEGTRIFLNLEDLSEQRRLEKLKADFVAMITHDLRTPLTAISLTISMLEQGSFGSLSESALRQISRAARSTDSLLKLVNDLLVINKLDSGRFTLDLEHFSLREAVDAALDCVENLVSEKDIEIEVLGENVWLDFDFDRMTQVLINLLSNAIKFSPKGGVITIEVDEDKKGIALYVMDDGPGVPEKAQREIFDRYLQVDASRKEEKRGTGLGLAICKEIVELHGGSLGVKPADGRSGRKGACFWLVLPRQNANAGVS